MENRYLRDFSIGFSQKHLNGGNTNSSSRGNGHGITATACENTPETKHLDIQQENIRPLVVDGAANKKRVSRIVGGGLRQFSIIVCKKVESKGKTTYSEVADEIIAEFSTTYNNTSLDEFDEKNIRRRVYDALNVLMALNIITKDKKQILWKGLPNTSIKDKEELQAQHIKLLSRIRKKATYLQELEEQLVGLQNLILRNQQLHKSGNAPPEGFSLPFILVQTRSHATVEIEISEDMKLVHFDFNSTPFSLHDDAYILKLMRQYQLPESRRISQISMTHSSSSSDRVVKSRGTTPFSWSSEILDTQK